MSENKELLFSIQAKDFIVQTFKAGGKGGQYQNKTESGVRIIHKDSEAVGECRNFRSQQQNKKEALRRLLATKEFQKWHKIKVANKLGRLAQLDEWITRQLLIENLKIEYKDENGMWKEFEEEIE